MSIFSHLFHHPPAAPTTHYPITGRDAEFIVTITVLYRQELGREPDPGGLASWLRAAQYGMTGAQLRQIFHDSPEGVAYRAIPPAPLNPTRLQGRLTARNGVFYDQTGARMVFGYSDFPLIRIWNDNKPEALRSLDAGVAAGRQVVRFGIPLVEEEDQNNGYWRGAHVSPEMAEAHFGDVLNALGDRGLKAHIFGSHNFGGNWATERAFLERKNQIIVSGGHQETIALDEWRNEYFMTSPYGADSDATYQHGAEACAMNHAAHGALCTMGSPGEDDDAIARSTTNAQVASVDFGRDYPGHLLMKHAHRAYYDGRYHGKYHNRGIWVTEPTGPNTGGGDVYVPLDDPAFLFGLHAIYTVTGQAVSFFNGPAVRHRYPIDTGFGFHEFPKMFREFFPEDIGEWVGPTWFTKGDEFVTVAAEEWGQFTGGGSNPDRDHPERKLGPWTALFYDGRRQNGEGPIGLSAGYKAAAVKGVWTR